MNIHPLFVHFPIAFLSLYSILELCSFGRIGRMRQIAPLKAFLLMIGVVAAFVTLQTGEMAEHSFGAGSDRSVIEMHSFFAGLTTYLYTFLALCYVVRMVEEAGYSIPSWAHTAWKWLVAIRRFALHGVIGKLLAFAALLLLLITGTLGASIVYGPEIDPFVGFIYHLLIK